MGRFVSPTSKNTCVMTDYRPPLMIIVITSNHVNVPNELRGGLEATGRPQAAADQPLADPVITTTAPCSPSREPLTID